MLYKAFISYSHQSDRNLASGLHSALHRFTKPWYKLRAIRVFRDQVNLVASPNLWSTIQAALDNSEYFILLASPQAAQSHWVGKEVEYWCETKDANKILIVLTHGQIVWDDATSDFDWQHSTALPAALSGKFTSEPLWVDLSWIKNDEEMSLRHLRFRNELATLAAPLHGRAKEELDSEDIRENRKTKRLARTAIAALTILTVSAAILAFLFYRQYRIASERQQIALSRQLAAQAGSYLDKQLDLALLLSVNAYQTNPTVEAKSSLLTALLHSPRLAAYLHGHKDAVTKVAFSHDGSILASASSDTTIILWDVATGQQLATLTGHSGGVNALAFSPDDKLLVSGSDDQKFIIWNVEQRKVLFERSVAPVASPEAPKSTPDGEPDNNHHYVMAIVFNHDGKKIAVYARESNVSIWDVDTAARLGEYPIDTKTKTGPDLASLGLNSISFVGDSESLAAYTTLNALLLWDAPGKPPKIYPLYDPMGSQSTGTFSHDGKTLAVPDDSGSVELWTVAPKPSAIKKIPLTTSGTVASTSFSWDDHFLAVGGGSGDRAKLLGTAEISVINLGALDQSPKTLIGHNRDIYGLDFSKDGSYLASGSYDHDVILWDLSTRSSLGEALPAVEKLADENPVRHQVTVALSADGKKIAAANSSGACVEWDVNTKQPLSHNGKTGSSWTTIAYTPGNVLRRISSDFKSVTVQEAANTRSFALPFNSSPVEGAEEVFVRLAASDDGEVLATQSPDGPIILWDLQSLARRPQVINVQEQLAALTLSHDGRVLAGYDIFNKQVLEWDTHSAAQLGSISLGQSPLGRMAFSHDGKLLAIGTKDDKALVWNAAAGTQKLWTLTGDKRTSTRSIAFSRDDASLAIGTLKGPIIFFDLTNGPLLATSQLMALDTVQDIAFDNSGKSLVSSTYLGKITIWDLDVNSWIARALRIANRDLTTEEKKQYLGSP